MSIGVLALKIGLVTAVTGTAIVTPILLGKKGSSFSNLENNSSSGVSHVVDSASVSDGAETETVNQQQNSLSENDSRNESHVEVPTNSVDTDSSDLRVSPSPESLPREQEEVQRAGENAVSRDQVSSVSSETPYLTDSFKKKCFGVPARSMGNENIQLLTCFDSQDAENADKEGDIPEYKGEFYVLDPSRNNDIPLKVEGKVSWEPSKNHVSVQMSQDTSATNKYTFVSEGDGWSGITKTKEIDIKGECSIYEITSQSSSFKETFWLSCADNTSEVFNVNSPTAIPLSLWSKTK